VLVLMDIADGFLTNALINSGIAREGNPVLMDVAGGTRFMVIKILGVLLAVLILWDIHRRHPRLAFWVSSVFLLIYAGIVSWNLHLLLTG
jgi:hypothetical protein